MRGKSRRAQEIGRNGIPPRLLSCKSAAPDLPGHRIPSFLLHSMMGKKSSLRKLEGDKPHLFGGVLFRLMVNIVSVQCEVF
jgi:hypothetical protein